MDHVKALVIKVIMITAVLGVIISWMYNYPIGNTITLAIIITVIAYLIGDLYILRKTNNTVATVADVALGALTIWLIGPLVMPEVIPFSVAFLSAIVIGVGEWFFHKYVHRQVFNQRRRGEAI
jgi:F0F1-type ATP synthase assembly protein I